MTDAIYITIPGQPVAKGRARVTRKGWAYTPKKTRDYEGIVKQLAKAAMKGHRILTGAVEVSILAIMRVPVSWSSKKREAAFRGGLRPITKPDLDNLVKNLDAMNGVVWKDDAQIVGLEAVKQYGVEPRLEIKVTGGLEK